MSNNKINLVVEVDEYCRDAIIRHRNGTYGAQLPYYIISSAFEAIANGTSITEGDLIMFRTLMTEIANKGLPFEEVLLLIDNANTPTEGDCISRSVLDGIRQLYKDYQPNLATEVIEFGDALENLIDNAQAVEITEEQAINKLHETGWLIGHDKEMTDRPKGEWIKIDEEWYDYKCSVCGEKVRRLYPFCHCGADMRKGGAE